MLSENWKDRIRGLHNAAVIHNRLIDLYWQDHFYSSGNKFGYPICAAIFDQNEKGRTQVIIIGWATYPSTCQSLLELVDAFCDELDTAAGYNSQGNERVQKLDK